MKNASGGDCKWRLGRVITSVTVLVSLTMPSSALAAAQRLTINPREQSYPVVSSSHVAWEDARNDSGMLNNLDIYAYKLPAGPEALVTSWASQVSPAISGSKVVYEQYILQMRNDGIRVHDLATGVTSSVTGNPSARRPDIDGNRVVYQKSSAGNVDIYMYDLATLTETRITTHPSAQRAPRIDGNRIVWVDSRHGSAQIYLHDISTGKEQRVANSVTDQFAPDVSGKYVVWEEERGTYPTFNSDIRAKNLSTGVETPVVVDPANQSRPRIYGDRVVWEDERSGNTDIYLANLTAGVEVPLVTGLGDQKTPDIHGQKVVYADATTGGGDIYLRHIDTSPPSAPTSIQAAAPQPAKIEVTWTPGQDNGGVAGYKVERTGNGAPFGEVAAVQASPYLDNGLPDSTAFTYRVRAYDGYANVSGYSPQATATTMAAPAGSKAVERIWGQTSAETAIEISKKGWVDGSSQVAVIARDDYFTDALAGGPLAFAMRYVHGVPAPILLTGPHSRPDALVFEVMRLGVTKIYLLGGPGAVDENVARMLSEIPGVTSLERLAGATAYGTSLAIKAKLAEISRDYGAPAPSKAIITTGENYPDALVISGPAASKGMPILLVKPFTSRPQHETVLALQGVTEVIIVGGPGAVHPELEWWLGQNGHTVSTRLWGQTEYDTAIDIASSGYDIFGMNRAAVFVTRGDYFTDALAGGPLAARWGPAPMVLVEPGSIPAPTNVWFGGYAASIQRSYVLGGWGAVSDGVLGQIEALIL